MKTLLMGMAVAGLVGVTSARAEHQGSTTDKSAATTATPSTPKTASDSSMSQTPSSQGSTAASGQASASGTGTSASASTELSGVVKKVDKDKHSLKISSLTGSEQELKISNSATITRDGSQASLDQIKEGDQVRASFDASGSQASKIEVSSKAKADSKSESKQK